MTHTLVTFLGRARQDRNVGYRRAQYRFPDKCRETPYFGVALADYLDPDALAILGTEGSFWSVLLEDVVSTDDAQDARERLMVAEESSSVGQSLLDEIQPLLEAALGKRVIARVIPFGKDADEQREILDTVAQTVHEGDVSFDVTHGFRHLATIGFLAAFMLERLRHLTVRGLWYGALDMIEGGVTPVIQLDGITRVRRWLDALDRFDATGDYGVFAPLLREDGVAKDKAECLERAAFCERKLDVSNAKQALHTFAPVLDEQLPGASGMFQQTLAARIRWIKSGNLADHQHVLALEYLKRNDFTRAAMFGWEALITRECQHRKFPVRDYRNGRSHAAAALNAEIRNGEWDERKHAAGVLQAIRNTLAHGSPPTRESEAATALKTPMSLRAELTRCFRVLFCRRAE